MEEKAELRRQMVASLSEQRAELQQEARAELDARVREVEERLTPRDAVTSAQCDALQERLAAMRAAELLTEPELHTLEDLLVRDGVSRIALLPAPCLPCLRAYLSVYCLHPSSARGEHTHLRWQQVDIPAALALCLLLPQADYVELKLSVGVLTTETVHAFDAPRKLFLLAGLSESIRADGAFARQARRKFLA
jgi:hypothetical protein